MSRLWKNQAQNHQHETVYPFVGGLLDRFLDNFDDGSDEVNLILIKQLLAIQDQVRQQLVDYIRQRSQKNSHIKELQLETKQIDEQIDRVCWVDGWVGQQLAARSPQAENS